MYYTLLKLKNDKMTQVEKKRMVAILYEAKINEEKILDLLNKYCNIDYEEALYLLQNEKIINAPCRRLEQFLLLEKGYTYEDADLFINRNVIGILVNNPELSKVTPTKLYDFAKEREKKKKV